jgi:hypothetical protein
MTRIDAGFMAISIVSSKTCRRAILDQFTASAKGSLAALHAPGTFTRFAILAIVSAHSGPIGGRSPRYAHGRLDVVAFNPSSFSDDLAHLVAPIVPTSLAGSLGRLQVGGLLQSGSRRRLHREVNDLSW